MSYYPLTVSRILGIIETLDGVHAELQRVKETQRFAVDNAKITNDLLSELDKKAVQAVVDTQSKVYASMQTMAELLDGILHETVQMTSAEILQPEKGHVFRCASRNCPGYPYKASDRRHPPQTCGAGAGEKDA